MSDLEKAVQRITTGVRSFADDMRDKGIHVGMGSTPRCVNCGEAWPCSRANGEASDGGRP